MSKFCTKCGNPVEFCTCPKPKQDLCDVCGLPKNLCICEPAKPTQKPQQTLFGSQYTTQPVQPSKPVQPVQPAAAFCTKCGRPKNQCICRVTPQSSGAFCTKCGNPIERCTCGRQQVTAGKRLGDFFGFGDSDKKFKDNTLEDGKDIVPVVIDPAKEEKFIKQYDVGRMRRRLTFSLGYSRILVTNKRVIERSVNKSIFGKDVSHDEYSIDEILGVSYERGKTFSFADFILFFIVGVLVSAIPTGIVAALMDEDGDFALVGFAFGLISIVLFILSKLFVRTSKKLSNFIAYLLLSVGFYSSLTGTFGEEICLIPAIICGVLAFAYLIISSFLPSISVTVNTKNFRGANVGMGGAADFRIRNIINKMIVLPADDAENALRELGAIINDVQKFGDYAVEKWSK